MKSRQWGLKLPAAVLPLLALAACATGQAQTGRVAAASSPPDPAARGVILSSRQVMLQIAGAGNGVLGVLSAPRGAGMTLAPASELIVRQDDGRVISVMEPVPNDFRSGERVRIQRGLETTLRPLK